MARKTIQPMMQRLIVSALAAATALTVASDARAQKKPKKESAGRVLVDRVVAVINEEVILHSELMRRVVPLSADLEQISEAREKERRRDKLKDQVVDDMINEELIVQAAVESKLEVSAKEVQGALNDISTLR